jgi:hypothetical protein
LRRSAEWICKRYSSCRLLPPALRALHAPVPQLMSRPAIRPDLRQIVEQLLRRPRPQRKALRVAHRAARSSPTIIHFLDHGRRMYRIWHARVTMNAGMDFAIGGNAPQYGIGATGTRATRQLDASVLTVAVDRACRTRSARKRLVPTSDAVQPAPCRGARVVPSVRRPGYRSRPSRVQRRSARRAAARNSIKRRFCCCSSGARMNLQFDKDVAPISSARSFPRTSSDSAGRGWTSAPPGSRGGSASQIAAPYTTDCTVSDMAAPAGGDGEHERLANWTTSWSGTRIARVSSRVQ